MEIKLGNRNDIDDWMDLVKKVKDDFPGLYKRFGFAEGKLTEEFGSPVQEFVLKR